MPLCLLSLLCSQGGQLNNKTESGGGYEGQGSGLKVRDSHFIDPTKGMLPWIAQQELIEGQKIS